MSKRFSTRNFKKAITLNGSNQYAKITDVNQTGIDFNEDNFMIGGWFRIKDDGGLQVLFGKYSGAGYANNTGGKGIELLYRGDKETKRLYFRVNNGDGSGTTVNSDGVNYKDIADGRWHFIVCIADRTNGQGKIYVDNVNVILNDYDNISGQVGSWKNDGDLVIGRQSGTGTGAFTEGDIDEFFYLIFESTDNIEDIIANMFYGNKMPSGLISRWKFDDNGNDSAGNNNLSVEGGPSYTDDVRFKPRTIVSKPRTQITLPRIIYSEGAEIDRLDSLDNWVKGDDAGSWELSIDDETEKLSLYTGTADSASITKSNLNIDLSKLLNLVFKAKVDDVLKNNGITIYFSNNNGSFTDYAKMSIGESNFIDGEIKRLVFGKSEFSEYNAFSWDNPIQTIRIRVYAQAGQISTALLHTLNFNFKARPKILVMHDDGHESVYDTAKPILDANNVLTTQAIISNRPDQEAHYMTVAEITEMFNDGHDIMNHTENHQALAPKSNEDIDYEIKTCDNFLETNGWHRKHKIMIYPLGSYDDDVIEITKKYCVMGRSTGSGLTKLNHIQFVGDLEYKIWALSVQNTQSVDDVKAYINQTIENQGVLFLTFHRIVTTPSMATEYPTPDYQAIIEYLAELRDANIVDLPTFNEYYEDITKKRYEAIDRNNI